MRILFLGLEFPPYGGGVGAYMFHMARALVLNGHESIFVTSRKPGYADVETFNGIKIHRIYNDNQKGSNKVSRQVLKLAEKYAVDWIEGADHLGECASLLKMHSRPSVVIKVHGCSALKILRNSHVVKPWQKLLIIISIMRQWRTIAAENYCIKHADLLLTPTWRMACELKRQYSHMQNSIKIVPNTLVCDFPLWSNESKKPTILFVGRIDIGKGIQWLPSIVKNLRSKNVCLNIAGGDSYARGLGSLKVWLEKQFERNDIEVRFLGKLSQEQLAEAYNNSWVVILPSRWDNFPTIILEAMKYRKAMVVSPFGGMVEMLEGTKSRVALPDSIDFSKEIDTFLADKTLRRNAGLSMRDKLETHYSPEKIAIQYVEAITAGLTMS